jgi:hydrogenase nickel incorporation protein HypA/HybF
MHEMALAEAVIDTALEVAEREEIDSIRRLVVRIGELQNIQTDVFEFALREIMPASEKRLASMEVVLEQEPARFRCRPCEREFALSEIPGPQGEDQSEAIHFIPELAHSYLRCPACNSPDFEVAAGRGVSIASIEGE